MNEGAERQTVCPRCREVGHVDVLRTRVRRNEQITQIMTTLPPSSNRQHLSCEACLEDKKIKLTRSHTDWSDSNIVPPFISDVLNSKYKQKFEERAVCMTFR